MGPPEKEEGPRGPSTETLTSTASSAISDEDTSRRLADLEARVAKLEKKPKRTRRGCIVSDDGTSVFVPGSGWVRRVAA